MCSDLVKALNIPCVVSAAPALDACPVAWLTEGKSWIRRELLNIAADAVQLGSLVLVPGFSCIITDASSYHLKPFRRMVAVPCNAKLGLTKV
jgi:hypothetical protein